MNDMYMHLNVHGPEVNTQEQCKEIILKSNHSNGVFKFTKITILNSVHSVSCQRHYKTSKPIPLGGLTPQFEKLTEILNRTNSNGKKI